MNSIWQFEIVHGHQPGQGEAAQTRGCLQLVNEPFQAYVPWLVHGIHGPRGQATGRRILGEL